MTSKLRFRGDLLSRVALNKRFRGYKLSRTPIKIAKSRKFIPAKVYTNKVINAINTLIGFLYLRFLEEIKRGAKTYEGKYFGQ